MHEFKELYPSGRPGIWVAQDRCVINMADFIPFETSNKIGLSFSDFSSVHRIYTGWRFTCAAWPADSTLLQQQVKLMVGGLYKAEASLASLVTLPTESVRDRDLAREDLEGLWAFQTTEARVELTEREIPEAVGLRVHLRGFRNRTGY